MTARPPPRMIMRTAMWTLYTEADRSLLQAFEPIEAGLRSDDPTLLSQSRIVWLAMVRLALDGVVEVTGHFRDTPVSQVVEPGLLVTSRPDFQKQTLQTDVGTFCGVLVQALEAPLPSAPPLPPARSGYHASDQALVAEMMGMVDAGIAPFAAATELAGRASGGGSPESKAKRLYKRYTQLLTFQN